ncbi:hypothetical protein ACJZ2D_008786 [Fusarium nematophilum]
MASSNAVSIYAELLSNIRQVSVVASLPSSVDSSTRAEVSNEGRQLQVTHQGQTERISLPTPVAAPPVLPVVRNGRSSLSWRLPVSPAEARPAHFSMESQALPWMSVDIRTGSQIACRECGNELVAPQVIKTWKDLPSENWAEMMEFWHCHKPHDHAQQDSESLASKGYSANHAISAQRGVGFVDLTSFLFSEPDCKGLKVSIQPAAGAFFRACPEPVVNCGLRAGEKEDVHVGIANLSVIWPSIQLPEKNAFLVPLHYRLDAYALQYSSSTVDAGFDISSLALDENEAETFLHVFCQKCQTDIGLFNILASSVTLFKWQITCQTISPSLETNSSECLAATLLATISRSGSSKSIITPHSLGPAKQELVGSQTNLYLWVLNPNVAYTASSVIGSKIAMKILYRHIEAEEGDKLITSMTSDVQEITLPLAAIQAAEEHLSLSSNLLPSQERTFKEWNVGLLGRWQPISC